jgi:hypothetical protein
MSRAEHTYSSGETSVTLVVPDGVEVPPWMRLKLDGDLVVFEHSGVRNVRAAAKRRTRQPVTAQRISADWRPDAAVLEKAAADFPSVNLEHESAQFVDYWLGQGRPMVDWVATWRRWMRKQHADNVAKGWKPQATPRDEDAKARWLREHGVNAEEYERRKGDAEWLNMINRRGRVA